MRRLGSIPALLLLVLCAACPPHVPGAMGELIFSAGDPMFGGEKAFAVGSRLIVHVDLRYANEEALATRSELRLRSGNESILTAEWEEPGKRALVELVGAGVAQLSVLHPDGTLFDYVNLEAREADRLAMSWVEPFPSVAAIPEDVDFDLAEVRVLEGGAPAQLRLDVLDAEGERLAGRMSAEVTMHEPGVVAAGLRLDDEGELLDQPPVTNRTLRIAPLSSGETNLRFVQEEMDVEGSVSARVVAAESAQEIAWSLHHSREAVEEGHLAGGLVLVFLRDEEGEVVHGGRFLFENLTPEQVSIYPEDGEAESDLPFMLFGPGDDAGDATVRIRETVTGLEAELELRVGSRPVEEDEEENGD